MKTKVSVLAVVLGLGPWAILAAALAMGGLDASSSSLDLKFLVSLAVLCALVAVILGGVGLIRGPRRVLAVIGLISACLFLLTFVGVVPWR